MRAPRPQANGYYWDPPDKEWLECQYVELKKSPVEIAYETGASPGTIRRWLQKLDLQPRTKAEAGRLYAGEHHPRWRGGVSGDYCSKQARKALQQAGVSEVCSKCGAQEFIDVHHIDGRITNNTLDNVCYLCRSCHRFAHERRSFLTKEEPNER